MWEVARTRLGRLADVGCIILMVLYNFVAHAAVVTAIVNFNLPPVPALVLSVEQVRNVAFNRCVTPSLLASIYDEELLFRKRKCLQSYSSLE